MTPSESPATFAERSESDALATVGTLFGVADPFADEPEDGDERPQEVAQLLLFRISEEWYAVPVSRVREVRQECAVSQIPCVPEFVLGVMSARGEVLSVIDLGCMMRVGGLEGRQHASYPAVVLENEECATAVVVHELGDIYEAPLDRVEPSVSIADRFQAAFVLGLIEVGERMVGLLDVDRILEPIGESARGPRIQVGR